MRKQFIEGYSTPLKVVDVASNSRSRKRRFDSSALSLRDAWGTSVKAVGLFLLLAGYIGLRYVAASNRAERRSGPGRVVLRHEAPPPVLMVELPSSCSSDFESAAIDLGDAERPWAWNLTTPAIEAFDADVAFIREVGSSLDGREPEAFEELAASLVRLRTAYGECAVAAAGMPSGVEDLATVYAWTLSRRDKYVDACHGYAQQSQLLAYRVEQFDDELDGRLRAATWSQEHRDAMQRAVPFDDQAWAELLLREAARAYALADIYQYVLSLPSGLRGNDGHVFVDAGVQAGYAALCTALLTAERGLLDMRQQLSDGNWTSRGSVSVLQAEILGTKDDLILRQLHSPKVIQSHLDDVRHRAAHGDARAKALVCVLESRIDLMASMQVVDSERLYAPLMPVMILTMSSSELRAIIESWEASIAAHDAWVESGARLRDDVDSCAEGAGVSARLRDRFLNEQCGLVDAGFAREVGRIENTRQIIAVLDWIDRHRDAWTIRDHSIYISDPAMRESWQAVCEPVLTYQIPAGLRTTQRLIATGHQQALSKAK
ncbi:MAG: hypothetical protein AAF432_11240 [Planctomycetota bacterium]